MSHYERVYHHRTLSINLDLSKVFFIENKFDYNFGIAYKALSFLELRAGYYNGYSLGMGFDFKSVSFNSGFNNNQDLGFVGQFDITLKFF